MSRVFLPIGKKAHTPFHIHSEGLEIYTLEELCFYIIREAELLERDFMSEALISFIRVQLCLRALAKELNEELQRGGALSGFCAIILESAQFLPPAELAEVIDKIRAGENESEEEKLTKKLKRLVENKEYSALLGQCQKALAKEQWAQEPQKRAELLMKQALGYARLFYFKPAAALYQEARRAYEEAKMPVFEQKAGQQYLLCLRLGMGEEEFRRFTDGNSEYLEMSMAAEQRFVRATSAVGLQTGETGDAAQVFKKLRREYERM